MGKFNQRGTESGLHSILSQMPEVEPPAFLLEKIEAATVAKRVPAYTVRDEKYAAAVA